MTLEQLRIFVAVAERQHMTDAAKALGLTQSAVSAAVAALEAQHDIRLFHRVGRGITLTDEGARFLAEARGVLARAGVAEQVLAEMGGLRQGTLRVHASQTIAGYWLPRRLMDFRMAYPGITQACAIGNTAQVTASVCEGDAELGFVEGVVDEASLTREVVARDRLLLVVGNAHSWVGRRQVRTEDLIRTDWVLREKGSGTRAILEAALADHGVDPGALRIVMELPSNEAVRAAVMASAAASVLSASVVAAGLEAGLLHSIRFPLPERDFCVLMHKERYLSRAAQAFLAIVRRDAQKRR